VIKVLAFVACLAAPEPRGDAWFGADKLKHFFMSAFIQSAGFSAARAAGWSGSNAQVAAGVSSLVFAVGKEVRDRGVSGHFSVKDLIWDGAGSLTAFALLNGTR
jgi:uncharacterized protein YfiM (DUF2279 family)